MEILKKHIKLVHLECAECGDCGYRTFEFCAAADFSRSGRTPASGRRSTSGAPSLVCTGIKITLVDSCTIHTEKDYQLLLVESDGYITHSPILLEEIYVPNFCLLAYLEFREQWNDTCVNFCLFCYRCTTVVLQKI